MFKLFFRRPKATFSKPERGNIKLVFGLGNPGEKYALTYHNTGQLYINYIAQGPFKKYRNFEFSKEGDLIFIKSIAFMNDSGLAAKEALEYLGLQIENLLVVHDDSDIPLGEYKLSFNQGSAGHNGVQSVAQHLKTQKFFRLRIGVRENQRGKAGEFILKPISKRALATLKQVFSRIDSFQLRSH